MKGATKGARTGADETYLKIYDDLDHALTTCVRYEYRSQDLQSLRLLLNTAPLLKGQYTYEQAADVVCTASRRGQARYECKRITSRKGEEEEEDLLFNLTADCMVPRRARAQPSILAVGTGAASSNALPPGTPEDRPHTHIITFLQQHPGLWFVLSELQSTLGVAEWDLWARACVATYIITFLQRHPGLWYVLSELHPTLGVAEWDLCARACIASGAACYWDDSSQATCWPGGCFLSWPVNTGPTGGAL